MRVVTPCVNSCVSNSTGCERAFDSKHRHHFPNTTSDNLTMIAVIELELEPMSELASLVQQAKALGR